MTILSQIGPRKGAKKGPKRIGRGESSGWGKTAGRGHKGQKARSSAGIPIGFEGGQMPLHRRSPKWGFTQLKSHRFQAVNLSDLGQHFKSGEEVTPAAMLAKRVIRHLRVPIKILGNGKLEISLKVQAHAFSQKAKQEIEAAKGSVSLVEWKRKSAA